MGRLSGGGPSQSKVLRDSTYESIKEMMSWGELAVVHILSLSSHEVNHRNPVFMKRKVQ
jgi:hypothetical protein